MQTHAVSMLHACRSVDAYERLDRISEGTYGIVFRYTRVRAQGLGFRPKTLNPEMSMLHACRSVDAYERPDRISEGTYGIVFRYTRVRQIRRSAGPRPMTGLICQGACAAAFQALQQLTFQVR